VNLPDWVTELRPHQQEAANAIVESFNTGTTVFFLDAPTGSGKTLIAELVRQRLSSRALYLCSTLALQSQFALDFPHAAILRGRANYHTLDSPSPDLSCADCVKEKVTYLKCQLPCPSCPPGPSCECPPNACLKETEEQLHCRWCHPVTSCPYESAKAAAFRSDLVCTNLSYFLNESNFVGNLTYKRQLIIIDEADLIEDALLHFVTVAISPRQQKEFGISQPEKKTVESAWIEWAISAESTVRNLLRKKPSAEIRSIRRHKSLSRLLDNIRRLNDPDSGLASGNWVYTGYDRGGIEFKPVRVDSLANDLLWRHCERWLLMSATTISFAVEADNLGMNQ
jgi:ATP-dependent DNA helicase DinG